MSFLDYLLGLALLALVLLNMRPHELTNRRLLRPLVIAAIICGAFLHGVPTSGAGGVLVAIGIAVGVACGAISARATRVERDPQNGTIVAVAGRLAVTVTAGAFAARLAFAIAATNGLGPAIGRFSQSVGIHSSQAWVASLVLMAAADLVVRARILARRRRVIAQDPCWTRDLAAA